MHNFCGIDFGTSNSAIGVGKNKVELVLVEDKYNTIPSALFFQAADKKILFGREAQKAYMAGEEGRFMRSLKRVLGTHLIDQSTVVNGQSEIFQDIIAIFVRNLKQKTLSAGYELDSVVMGRPVHFVDNDQTADNRAQAELLQIAKKVGFKNIDFQYEPIAAAFAHEQNLSQEKLSLVVDIGGGTSDFTIIRLSPERKKNTERKNDILANTGVRIGGNDFDKDLSLKSVMPYFGYNTTYGAKGLIVPRAKFHDLSEWSKVNFVYDANTLRTFKNILKQSDAYERLGRFVKVIEHQLGHHLLDSIETAKIELTQEDKYLLDLSYIEDDFAVGLDITQLNNAIENNILKIKNSIWECLKISNTLAENIELIILTGGSTEIPYIQSVISGIFPKAAVSQENKLSSVALGLTYDAMRKFS